MAEDEMAKVERPLQNQERPTIRHFSKQGMYPTLTFMNFPTLPDLFSQTPPTPWTEANPDYGKYKDPLTGKPYNTVEEFKQLRKQYFAQVEKGGRNKPPRA
jgi:hypothetical protein